MKKNVWFPVEGHPEIQVGQYVVPNFISNSVAVEISENEYLVYSPGASLLDSWPEDKRNEDTKFHIVMPNHWHYMGVPHWLEKVNHVRLYTSEKALPQVREKLVKEVHRALDIVALENRQPPLPEDYSFLFPPGHRGGDVWLRKRKDDEYALWIICDSFLNYERVSNQPVAKMMQKLLGAAPGLKISEVVKWLVYDNRKTFRQWVLNQLAVDRPTTLIPSHGEVAQDTGLYNQLANLVASRL